MQRVQAVERTVMLLRYVANASGPVGIRECSRALGVPRSALHRIAHTLAATGMLQSDTDGRYRLGPLARGIAGGFAEDHRLLGAAMREMETDLKDVTSHIGRIDGGRVLVLAAREGQGPVKVSVHAGDRFYVHCTAIGKALLASLDDAEIADIVRAQGLPPRTPHTITTPAAFRRELVQVRKRGFAVTMEESTLGVASIGAPIRVGGAVPTMALSVSVAVQDVRTREALNRMAQRVLLAAERIAAAASDLAPDGERHGPAPAGLAAH
jgi:DNA-binding IclR family transcriptional regulator